MRTQFTLANKKVRANSEIGAIDLLDAAGPPWSGGPLQKMATAVTGRKYALATGRFRASIPLAAFRR
ncbi:hypothetical protein [Paraburkholderia caledonica]|uniref:hypothetical protein n=1 Tax=Paraburkholderia caledonica TaxID=134536 RepID=UPI000DEFD163|nr:hypothetical protein [Paraburkholderia caledonica]AXF18918.1 hypothetical protein CUJ87_31745 [Paraburkholderia caledonica]